MSALREAAQQALEALERGPQTLVLFNKKWEFRGELAITALRAALAQEQAEPVVGIIEPQIKEDSHQTLDDTMQQPRAMAQAYESGYSAGVANEREACAKVCESRFMGDMTREDMEARRCAAAIRARGEMP